MGRRRMHPEDLFDGTALYRRVKDSPNDIYLSQVILWGVFPKVHRFEVRDHTLAPRWWIPQSYSDLILSDKADCHLIVPRRLAG